MSKEMDGEQESFADVMQGVQPLSKGKNVVRSNVRESSEIAQENRRLSAEGKLKQAKDENYLTLGEVHSKAPLEYLEWKKIGIQLSLIHI